MVRIDDEIVVDTDETDQRFDPLHPKIRKDGTISSTLSKATELAGTIRRTD